MASEISDDDDGYPWLSWARTGVLTLASVLIVGLVISAWKPRPQQVAGQSGTADAATPQVRPSATTDPPPATPAPAASASPAAAGSASAADVDPFVAGEMPVPAATAAPAPRKPAESDAGPRVSESSTPAAHRDDAGPMPGLPSPWDPPPSLPSPPPPNNSGKTSASRAPQANGRVSSPPSSVTIKVTPEAVAVKGTPATEDAAKHAAFVRAVVDVRAAMGQRNLAASKRNLQTAAANAQGPADQAELERLQALQEHLQQFWDAIRHAVSAMQPLEEIVLSESDRVAVISASREELAVQREGRPRRYRIEAIPMDLLAAIAKSTFKLTAGTKLIVGSFLAMDSLGDRTQAGKLWR